MHRRSFLQFLPFSALADFSVLKNKGIKQENDREYWINTLTTIANPVLQSLSRGQLKAKMPVESVSGQEQSRKEVTYLEAFGRLMAGMAPWLELGPDNSPEGKLRQKYITLARQSLTQAVNPDSPDYMNFTKGGQPLVDAAFLAHALIRAPHQLWFTLDTKTQQQLIAALLATRSIKPPYNNWLLFSGMIEAALLKFTGQWDAMRVDYAIRQHMAWYKGDGVYGDGPDFHFDYYNSYVIQPMLIDILLVMDEKGQGNNEVYNLVLRRAQRYAAIQERLISPEGTFPPTGRSLAYRFGAFQLLAQLALMKALPGEITASQVRSALTAVIKKCMAAPLTFDKEGWLKIGLYGSQPGIGEGYISTGSLYLCTTGLVSLGLKPEDEFWSGPATDWTAKKVWSGQNVDFDKALS